MRKSEPEAALEASCGLLAQGSLRQAARSGVASLFEPFRCGSLRLGNRIAMAPMTRWHSPGGTPGPEVARYYARRAAGGAGLIITEGVNIDHPAASGYDDVPAMYGEAALRGWRAVVDAVHADGAAIVPQLWHVGAFRRAGVGPQPAQPGVGPHRIVEKNRVVVRKLDRAGIEAIVASYARAARAAADIGFDGVEIHGAHGYLLDQFMWRVSNRRRDEYGGGIEPRARFAAEVVAGIRKSVPADFPVIFRFSQWKMHDYQATIGDSPAELGRLLAPLCAAGVDMFHVSTRRFSQPAFADRDWSLARWTREFTGRPVIAVGSIGLDKAHQSRAKGGHEAARAEVADASAAAEALGAGHFDLIAVGRAMLADAEWARKVREGRIGDIEPLRPHHLRELG